MRLWIDLANSPHVPFFRALIDRFKVEGHEIEITARDFAETVPLANAANLSVEVVGVHGGRPVSAKAGNLVNRGWSLAGWARKRKFDLAISHNSYSQILAAAALRLKCVTLMDYEYQPANHLAFRLTSKIIVPTSFPDKRLRRYGANPRKVCRYHGTKEDVYLADFQPDPSFASQLSRLGIASDNVLVVMRPPAYDALYHRFQNSLFDEALRRLLTDANVRVVLLPRSDAQRAHYGNLGPLVVGAQVLGPKASSPAVATEFTRGATNIDQQAGTPARPARANLIIPPSPLDGANLIAASDLVISAGGTINREAAALGVPVASVYAGKWAAVDEQLVQEGRLKRLSKPQDVESLIIAKKQNMNPRRSSAVIDEVVSLIFE
jgi:hypothetical protein